MLHNHASSSVAVTHSSILGPRALP
jgi:hypothetical protein